MHARALHHETNAKSGFFKCASLEVHGGVKGNRRLSSVEKAVVSFDFNMLIKMGYGTGRGKAVNTDPEGKMDTC